MAHNTDIAKLLSVDQLFWLGIHNMVQPLNYKTVHGMNLTFTNWKFDEPKFESKSGISISSKHDGKWKSLKAEEKLNFMCMYIIRAEDINECATNAHNCHSDAICTNTIKGFTCSCNPGYVGNGIVCSDIDECIWNSNICHSNAKCTNLIGNYECECYPGFDGDGLLCSDKNECDSDAHDCHSKADCINTVGSRNCVCNAPYWEGNGVGSKGCSDVDECGSGSHQCKPSNDYPDTPECINHNEGYTCKCPIGFELDDFSCNDLNECELNQDSCQNTICVNNIGSYTCGCQDGFILTYGNTCIMTESK